MVCEVVWFRVQTELDELDLTYSETLSSDMLRDRVNEPYIRPQKPLASASNVVNWHEVISTGTPEQHSYAWLLAGAQVIQVGGRAWIEPGHDGDIATMNDRAFVFSSQCAMGLEPVGMPNIDRCMKPS